MRKEIKIIIIFGLVLLFTNVTVIATSGNVGSIKQEDPDKFVLTFEGGKITGLWYVTPGYHHFRMDSFIYNDGKIWFVPPDTKIRVYADYDIDATDFIYEPGFHYYTIDLYLEMDDLDKDSRHIFIDYNGGHYTGTLSVEVPFSYGQHNWELFYGYYDNGGTLGQISKYGSCFYLPKSREINSPFLNFLQSHPNMFPLLQILLQKLGQL